MSSYVVQAQAAEGLMSDYSASSSGSSSCGHVHAGHSLLERLPQALRAEIFTRLPYGGPALLNRTSRSIRNSISQIPRTAPAPLAAALEYLADYRSSISPGAVALNAVNAKIQRVQQAVRAANAPQATRAANANASATASASAAQPIPVPTNQTLQQMQNTLNILQVSKLPNDRFDRVQYAILAAHAPQATRAANANASATASASAAQPIPVPTNQTLEQMQNTLNILQASKLPNDQFDSNTLKLIDEYAADPRVQYLPPSYALLTAIGPEQSNRYLGQVPNVPLPPHVEAMAAKPCEVFKGKTVAQTHVLSYIPPTINGQVFTLNRFLAHTQNPQNGGKPVTLNVYWEKILKDLGDKPVPPGWIFTLKTCFPGTKNEIHPDQEVVLQVSNEQKNTNHREAILIELIFPVLMTYMASKESDTRLFNDEHGNTSDTIIDDNGNVRRLDFGGFGPGGPSVGVSYVGDAYAFLGLGVVRRCGSSALGT